MNTLENIGKKLLCLDDYAIIGHSMPDGDSIGSILALYLALRKKGKRVTIIMQDSLSSIYDYLPAIDDFYRPEDIEEIPGHVIFLDCASLERIGESLLPRFQVRTNFINIDHHQDNDFFGQDNYVEPLASSTAEIVFRLLKSMEIDIDADIANCLYAGIIMDTGSFMNSNTSSTTMRAAAELLDLGADVNQARNNLLESKPLSEVLLLSLGLKNLEFHQEGQIACMKLPYEEIININALDVHPEGTINYLRSIKGVKVALLLREVSPGLIKISFRSKDKVDVAALAASLGGGGHKMAAGAKKNGSLDEVSRLLFDMIEDVL
ncbi:MAG: bifunctional oligoribonuclease/PAP phosphatase NrnA [Syntrophomonadaceae bacterium]|jgi:phosphoesterase RecJ-like protein|nr:bifunctional oligoribonuclease/PAP phosphatase NrnA [Syntrophomonadaceae bacterium]